MSFLEPYPKFTQATVVKALPPRPKQFKIIIDGEKPFYVNEISIKGRSIDIEPNVMRGFNLLARQTFYTYHVENDVLIIE